MSWASPASDHTVGHPTLSPDKIKITSADNYESALRDSGKVLADMDERLKKIWNELRGKNLDVGRADLLDSPESIEFNTARQCPKKQFCSERKPAIAGGGGDVRMASLSLAED